MGSEIGNEQEKAVDSPIDWLPVSTAAAAWLALGLSLLSLLVSRRAQKLSERQEERRKPLLVPYLLDGFVRVGEARNGRVYAWLVSVSNPSDTDNGLAAVDLRLTYTTRLSHEMTIKVRSDAASGKAFGHNSGQHLPIPAQIDAHKTIQGWVYFRVDDAVLDGATVEGHTIALVDSHGIETVVEPIIVREIGDETEATASRDTHS